MSYRATMTTRGRVTLPRSMRSNLDLKPGNKVSFKIEDKQVIVDFHKADEALPPK